MDEYRMEVERVYDLYLMETEGRGASYGEIAYIEGLNKRELDALYKEAQAYFDERTEEAKEIEAKQFKEKGL